MSRPLFCACVLVLAWLLPAVAVPPDEGPAVRCGTNWLRRERAAGRMQLPQPVPASASKRAQDSAPIQVGTELLFPVGGGSGSLIPATCQRVGAHAYVFVENRHWDTNGGSILQSHVDALSELFDTTSPADPTRGVYELEIETFGAAADVDGDPRIFLLVLDIIQGNVVGYFDPAVAAYEIPEYRRDVLFIGEKKLRRSNYLALGTLAHEFQHLIHWGWDEDEDIWVDEGLSGFAEELVGFPEADPNAVPQFLQSPHTSLTDWNFTSATRSYGVTYLFMSFLAERYGARLISEFVAQPRNGTAGLDAAMEARQETDRFIDVWQKWTVGNYAAAETGFGYGALGQRRVQTLDVEIDMLPLENAPLGISGRWGTANVLFRTPGDLLIDFDASDDVGRYNVWTYAMSPAGATLREVVIGSNNRGLAQLSGIDSALVIVGRTSQQGQNFRLSARASKPTVVDEVAVLRAAPALAPAYPNPFNSSVRIPYNVAMQADVELAIYDLAGQQVRRLVSQARAPGRYEVVWDGLDAAGHAAASGTYLTRLRLNANEHVQRLSLIR